jgi:hypothetical protein
MNQRMRFVVANQVLYDEGGHSMASLVAAMLGRTGASNGIDAIE